MSAPAPPSVPVVVPVEYLERLARLLRDSHFKITMERAAQRPRLTEQAIAEFRALCRGAATVIGTIGHKLDRITDLAFKESNPFPPSPDDRRLSPFEKTQLYRAEVEGRIVAGIQELIKEVNAR